MRIFLQTQFRPAATLLLFFTVLTGAIYPAIVTVLAQTLFPHEAGGSLIVENGRVVGSALIGQPFVNPQYFRSRPSATPTMPYNGLSSSGSNLGPTNVALHDRVSSSVAELRELSPMSAARPVPVDLVTTSGSGLDPHISVAAAEYQVERIAQLRGVPEEQISDLVRRHTEPRTFGVLGEPRVQVLRLNLALDKLSWNEH